MSKGLELLSEQLAEAEHRCAMALAKARQDLKLFMEQYDALGNYRQIYLQQWTERGLEGMAAQQNVQYQAFINKLQLAAEQQYEGVLQVRQVVEQRKQEWLAMQQRRKAVALLLEKKALRERQKAERQEQKMLDEFATRSFLRNSGL
ncbi:flagellar export protein FliJ [Aeromonas schubertii]|uniref:Flagellar FliJ protein n=1 Tax=Aeromonas schubertii TaxID=652 RepID=A0A0S2SM93_9GAMM|nr:flagellar export protein FliJ [Aeromonas schubertii]ALP42843.1 flagellar protein FliJ [Aeromonas schubertii]KUE80406.1 flagellar export protein FliJ [Aeromonas schubertii]MBZ6066154.1 flagellar export protein FliJ [Aeromonas schubertii]MBZ6071324.1 flagellar export protein FliJ [Aeromonas schubertii]QCG47667.1 flagellar export protein FliJ [Aeromonas schubertii]